MDSLFAKPVNQAEFERLVGLLDAHGAQGYGHGSTSGFSELDRWDASRTIFACLPAAIVEMRPVRDKYVPVLKHHLAGMRIDADKNACLVLKGVCEQLVMTDARRCAELGLKAVRKFGVADLRQQGHYQGIRNRQNGRCSSCGVRLGGTTDVELDHHIPFSLIGDVYDGANWRLLCKLCNFGKHEFLSALLSADSWNWVSPRNVPSVREEPTSRARYAIFATKAKCEQLGCGKGPLETQLFLQPTNPRGLRVPSNMTIRCESHFTEQG